MQISPTSSALGAEVTGVDLCSVSDAELDTILDAWAEHGVLFFRDQDLSPEDHIAFAERLGPININRFFSPVDGHPEVAEVLKEPDQQQNIGGGWHTDHSYDTEPAMGSVLYARELPPVGGDTLFSGMGAAWDALSDGFKEMLRGLRAVHSSRHVFGEGSPGRTGVEDRIGNAELATQDSIHPVVIAHPRTGRPLLYVNPGFTTGIEGWSPAESKALLSFLFEHAARPEFQTRFRWSPGAVAMWDNRSTWHFALNDYHGHRRYLHRITIEGGPLDAAT
jgi:taurine dioxygenase